MDEMRNPLSGKIRESGMPSEKIWGAFFDVEEILNQMQMNSQVVDAADFACGYGTFSIPTAQRIAGILYAVDIDPAETHAVEDKSRSLKLSNVRTIVRDLLRDGSGLEDVSVDYVMLFNILHFEEPLVLLREAFRVLRQNGRVGIIHWIRNANTPRGPPLEMRPTAKQCKDWCRQVGFVGSAVSIELPPYHFGFIMSK